MISPFESSNGTLDAGGITGGQRWFPIWNTEEEAIPPWSVVEVMDGYVDDSGKIYAKVQKPTGTSGAILALTGRLITPAASSGTPAKNPTGMATRDGPAWMAYDSDDGAPTNGELYGAKADFWVGKPRVSDLLVVGAPQTDVTPKRVLVIFPGSCPPANAIWGISLIGTPNDGTFKLKYLSQATSTLSYNISVASIQSALEALPNIGTGNVLVTGIDGGFNYHVEFKGDLANQSITGFVIDGSLLVGHGVGAITYLVQQGG